MRRIVLALSALIVIIAAPAMALPESAQTVSTDPVDWTPHVLDGEVRAITTVGDTVVVGGDFVNVTDSSGAHAMERWFLFAFSLSTGKILDFAPWLDGS